MATLLQPARWRQQPSGPTELDRAHPLARGLVFGVVGNAPGTQDLVGGARFSPLGTSGVETFGNGVGLYSPSITGNGWYAKYNPDIFRTFDTEFTIACEFAAETLGDSSRIISIPYANGTFAEPKHSFSLRRMTTTTTIAMEMAVSTLGSRQATFYSGVFAETTSTYIGVRSGSSVTLSRNGTLLTQAGSIFLADDTPIFSTASEVVLLNRSSTSMGSGTGGGVLWAYIWNRALSDAEQASLYNTPYDFIKPPSTQRFYLSPIVTQDEWTGDIAATLPRPVASVTAASSAPNRSGGSVLTAPRSAVSSTGGLTQFVAPNRAAAVSAVIGPLGIGAGVTVNRPSRIGAYALALPALSASVAGSANILSPTVTGSVLLPKLTVAGSIAATYAQTVVTGDLAFPPVSVLFRASTILPSLTGSVAALLPRIAAQVTGRPFDPLNNPGVSHIIAPPWRTVDFGDGTTATNWLGPLDPGELKAYTINCAKELDAVSAQISKIGMDLSALATTAGLRIYARTNDSRNITVWFYVNESDRVKTNWNAPGELHTLTCTITSSRGQIFERTIGLTIKQLGYGG